MDYEFKPGVYKVRTRQLLMRTTPQRGISGNLLKPSLSFQLGDRVKVYDIREDVKKTGEVWGEFSLPETEGSLFICLWDRTTLYAELIKEPDPKQDSALPTYMPSERTALIELCKWAKAKGYLGPTPF